MKAKQIVLALALVAVDVFSEEYIGIDEKLAVESLLRVIESEGTANGIARAKGTYEFVTGEE